MFMLVLRWERGEAWVAEDASLGLGSQTRKSRVRYQLPHLALDLTLSTYKMIRNDHLL